MKNEKGYRYTIQFGSISPQHEAVGEYLESLKNKKAECIVRAVSDYMLRNKGGDTGYAGFPAACSPAPNECADANAQDAGNKAAVPAEPALANAQDASGMQLDAMLDSLNQW